jgi:hypothetical protein
VPWVDFAEKYRQQTLTSGTEQYPRLRIGQPKQTREYAGHAGQVGDDQKAGARAFERINERNRGITDCLGIIVKGDVNNDAAAPALGPNAMPMKVTNDPVLGLYFENSASVLLRKRIATIATMIVSGAATPAPTTITPKPK